MSDDQKMHSLKSLAAVIRVTGEDAFSFLQGQFTNELRQAKGSATYGLWLNQKGRVLADSLVLRMDEQEFLLISESSASADIMKRLEDYIVADDVTLSDQTTTTRAIRLWGSATPAILVEILGAAPDRGRFQARDGLIATRSEFLPGENFLVLGTDEALAPVRARLPQLQVREASSEETEHVRILAGIPSIPRDIGPTDLPNEGGLDVSAISYTKGCYLGQEVMARLKNLGQVRRRLHVVRGKAPTPAAQTPLFQAGKQVGEIRTSAGRNGQFVAFAMLTLMNLNPALPLGLSAEGPDELTLVPHG